MVDISANIGTNTILVSAHNIPENINAQQSANDVIDIEKYTASSKFGSKL